MDTLISFFHKESKHIIQSNYIAKLDDNNTENDNLMPKSDSAKPNMNTKQTITLSKTKVRDKNMNKCVICGCIFSAKADLKRHIESIREGKKQHKGKTCGYRFSRSSSLKTHIESVHEKKKPHKCSICDYRGSQKGNLKKHIESVHEEKKPHKCLICVFSSSRYDHLRVHIESVHEKKKPHKCPYVITAFLIKAN